MIIVVFSGDEIFTVIFFYIFFYEGDDMQFQSKNIFLFVATVCPHGFYGLWLPAVINTNQVCEVELTYERPSYSFPLLIILNT